MTRIQFNNGFLVLFSEPYLCLSLLPFSLEVFLLYTHASLQLFGSAINHYLLKIYTLFPLKTSDWNLLQSKAVI